MGRADRPARGGGGEDPPDRRARVRDGGDQVHHRAAARVLLGQEERAQLLVRLLRRLLGRIVAAGQRAGAGDVGAVGTPDLDGALRVVRDMAALAPDQHHRAHSCLDALFTLVLDLKGTLSGEHGVGIEKRDYVEREIDPVSLSLMAKIKSQFDPKGILNWNKGFPMA